MCLRSNVLILAAQLKWKSLQDVSDNTITQSISESTFLPVFLNSKSWWGRLSHLGSVLDSCAYSLSMSLLSFCQKPYMVSPIHILFNTHMHKDSWCNLLSVPNNEDGLEIFYRPCKHFIEVLETHVSSIKYNFINPQGLNVFIALSGLVSDILVSDIFIWPH